MEDAVTPGKADGHVSDTTFSRRGVIKYGTLQEQSGAVKEKFQQVIFCLGFLS